MEIQRILPPPALQAEKDKPRERPVFLLPEPFIAYIGGYLSRHANVQLILSCKRFKRAVTNTDFWIKQIQKYFSFAPPKDMLRTPGAYPSLYNALWNTPKEKRFSMRSLSWPMKPHKVAIAPSGSFLVTTYEDSASVHAWYRDNQGDWKRKITLREEEFSRFSGVDSVIAISQSNDVVVTNYPLKLHVWKESRGKWNHLGTYTTLWALNQVLIFSNSRSIIGCSLSGGSLLSWDIEAGHFSRRVLKGGSFIQKLLPDPLESSFIADYSNGCLGIWRKHLKSWQEVQCLKDFGTPLTSFISLNSTGSHLLSLGMCGELVLFERRRSDKKFQPAPVQPPLSLTDDLKAATFVPQVETTRLLTANRKGDLFIYQKGWRKWTKEMFGNSRLSTLHQRVTHPRALVFDPQSTFMFVIGESGTTNLWSLNLDPLLTRQLRERGTAYFSNLDSDLLSIIASFVGDKKTFLAINTRCANLFLHEELAKRQIKRSKRLLIFVITILFACCLESFLQRSLGHIKP